MYLEIWKALKRCLKSLTAPGDENEWLKYLTSALYNARKKYYSKEDPTGLKVSAKTKKVIKSMEDFLKAAGTPMTSTKAIQDFSRWHNIDEKKARYYYELMNRPNDISLDIETEDGEMSILDLDTQLPYLAETSNDPVEKYVQKILKGKNAPLVYEAIQATLDKQQRRARDCYRALFTVFCIDHGIIFEENPPFIDNEIMEEYDGGEEFKEHRNKLLGNNRIEYIKLLRNNRIECNITKKKPNQYEVYMKHHPETKQGSAMVLSTKMLRKFLNDLHFALKDEFSEISL